MTKKMKKQMCWNCGKREATQEVYGYPVCDVCAEEGIDPEEMELVVIESVREGEIVPLDTIKNEENDKKRRRDVEN